MEKLSDRLCSYHKKKFCCLFGNGTTAIIAALKSKGIQNQKIAVPNNVCFNVPLAVYYSDNVPVFLDVDEKDLSLSKKVLERSPEEVEAVIAVHNYGCVCDIESIQSFCKKKKIFLIEDIAVAQGARVNGFSVGGYGDIVVGSFGAGKIIDVGHGGFALTDDEKLYAKLKGFSDSLQPQTDSQKQSTEKLGKEFTQTYNDGLTQDRSAQRKDFFNKALSLRQSFLSGFDSAYENDIIVKWDRLNENIKNRESLAQLFSQQLKDEAYCTIFVPPEGSVYWRYNIYVHEGRNGLLKWLLKKKYKVSSWHTTTNSFFNQEKFFETPISNRIADQILNLWVNEEVDAVYVERISSEIKSFFKSEKIK